MDKSLQKAFRFFYEHAGYVVGERARCALDLAKAERAIEDRDWHVDWEFDARCDDSWMSAAERLQPHEWLCTLLRDADGRVLASLGGICDADRNYGRVVEAELAHEALATEWHETRNAQACAASMVL